MEKQCFEELLYLVEKPSRYIGGELNAVVKPMAEVKVHFGFAFPDVYEVGMSHLGSHILYFALNKEEGIYCERIYSPWPDMEKLLRENQIPLLTVETRSPIGELDIIGFTLQHEMSYTNILNILDLGGIPLLKTKRDNSHPLVIAGGPVAYHAEPMADFIDVMLLGEGEELIVEFTKLYEVHKPTFDRQKFLEAAAAIEGVYIPEFYDVTYKPDGTVLAVVPNNSAAPIKVTKRIIVDMDAAFYPDRMIVPYSDVVHGRSMIELFRGCTRGCRFCQAGMIYRPVREKSAQTVIRQARLMTQNTGYEEMSLTSLSTMDYTKLAEVVSTLTVEHEQKKIGVSLPSLRMDSFSVQILQDIQKVRKTGLTFAPEAGSQRMRDVINKNVTDEDIDRTVNEVFQLGWSRIKLYFMIGLPTETTEDLEGINEIGNKVTFAYKSLPREMRAQQDVAVTISTSTFVPKPFTPFQWMAQDTLEVVKEKQAMLRRLITNKKIKYAYHDPYISMIEGVLARGDRRLGAAILKSFELGSRFDGWDEFFKFETWMRAFEDAGIEYAFYNHRVRPYDECLPWDHIDVGVEKTFLIDENERAVKGLVSPDCRDTCLNCGVNTCLMGGCCYV